MSMFNVFNISGSALHAQTQRFNVVASNMANADSAVDSFGNPYIAKQVYFETVPMKETGAYGVRVSHVLEDTYTPMQMKYDPKHPMANEDGYVQMPNVNVVDEMVNMISTSRSYQSNIEVMNTAKQLVMKVLALGQ